MKIVRYIPALPPCPGGMEEHGKALSITQSQKHQLWLLFGLGSPLPRPVRSLRLAVGWKKNPGYLRRSLTGVPKAWQSITDLHRKEALDLIHCHGEILEAIGFGLLGKKLNIPTVITVHGTLPERSYLKRLYRWAFEQVSSIICVSPSIKNQLVKHGISSDKIAVISSGIDFQSLSKAEAQPQYPWRHTFLFVGRLHPVKGIDYLLQALAQVAEKRRDIGLVIAGDGQLRPKIESAIENGLPIKMLGRIPRGQLPAIYQSAHYFILPSITLKTQAEGTPTSLMEAMAAALPVIATDSGGISNLVDNSSGLIVPEKNSVALSHAMLELVSNPQLASSLAKNGQKIARSKDWSVLARKIDRIYDHLLGEIQ